MFVKNIDNFKKSVIIIIQKERVFEMNLKTRLFSGVLAVVTIASLSACKTKGHDAIISGSDVSVEMVDDEVPSPKYDKIGIYEDNEIEKVSASLLPKEEASEIEEDSTKSIEDILDECLYDDSIDYESIVSTYLADYDLRMANIDTYLKAIYTKMRSSNVPMSVYLEELDTMAIMQQVPTCVPEDVWEESFEHLILLQGDNPSLFEMFADLAIYVHEITCENEHNLNEFGCYTCDDLSRKLELAN